MPQDNRLLSATEAALGPLLGPNGFTITGSTEQGRGSTVECSSGHLLIGIVADWLEGELTIDLQVEGGRQVPLAEVVDVKQAQALSLTRLPRRIGRAGLQRRIEQVGQLIQEGLPGAIEGRREALDALR